MADAPLVFAPGQTVAQGDWEALAHQHGEVTGAPMLRAPTQEEIKAAALAHDDDPAFLQNPIYRYVFADGSYVEARLTGDRNDYRIIDYKPSQRFQQTHTAAQANLTPEQRAAQAAQAQTAQAQAQNETALNNERSWNEQHGNGRLTHAEVAARERQATIDAQNAANVAADNRRADEAAARQAAQTNKPVVTLAQDGTQAVITYPDGHVETKPTGLTALPKPGQVVPHAGPNGEDVQAIADPKTGVVSYQPITGAKPAVPQPGTIIRGGGPRGEDVQAIADPRTGQISYQPIPGAPAPPTTAGPPLPTIILGHSQDALREFQAQLDAEVVAGRMTPAQRTARWNEALQMAQHTLNEATLQQRENESTLNASVNLATNRLSNSTSGFNSALSFISAINDKLPVGSSLGGKAFMAILGLQVMQAQRMGAYDNIVPGSQPSAFGRGGDAAQASDTRATMAAQPQQAQPAPAAPAQAEADRQQAAAVAAAAGPSTGPTGQVPQPGGSDIPGASPTPMSAPPAINPATGQPTGPAPLPGQRGAPPVAVPPTPAWQPYQPGTTPVVVRTFPGHDPRGNPATVTEYNDGHSEYSPVAAVAPAQDDFAVLAQARGQAPPTVPLAPTDSGQATQPQPAAAGGDVPPAVLHSQARVTPPWRLSPAQVQQMLAAGVPPETIWGVPGAAA